MSSPVNPPRRSGDPNDITTTTTNDRTVADAPPPTTREVVRQQRERFGGMKFGSCFFGWLAATGTALLLTGLVSAVGAGVGLAQNVTPDQAVGNVKTVGLISGIVLLVIILVAYFAGGYVAGRMARFNGARQGLGVWLWALIAAVVVAGLGLLAGNRFNVLARLNGFPRIPVNEGTLTVGAIVTAVILALAALIGAVLGGIAGMRYHRRVDRATYDSV